LSIKAAHALELALLVCHAALRGQRTAVTEQLTQANTAARALSRSLDPSGTMVALSPSAAQRKLLSSLRSAGWAHEDEVRLEDGLVVVDMACTATRVVVEFDGPDHYLLSVQSGEETYNGNTLLKTRLLEWLGWRVHRVGWRAWALDPDGEAERLAARLRAGPAAEGTTT
jgi:very-short-patch-repair endonuclease